MLDKPYWRQPAFNANIIIGESMMANTELVSANTLPYNEVCAVAGETYHEHLDLRPLRFPPEFIVIRGNDGTIIGGGGIQYPNPDQTLLIEMLLEPYQEEVCEYLSRFGATPKGGWAEITCFFCASGHAREIPSILYGIFEHIRRTDRASVTLNILTRPLRNPLGCLGADITELGEVKPEIIRSCSLPTSFVDSFERNYLEPRRRPKCVGISVDSVTRPRN